MSLNTFNWSILSEGTTYEPHSFASYERLKSLHFYDRTMMHTKTHTRNNAPPLNSLLPKSLEYLELPSLDLNRVDLVDYLPVFGVLARDRHLIPALKPIRVRGDAWRTDLGDETWALVDVFREMGLDVVIDRLPHSQKGR
jgi:hypothetical protein